MPGVNVGDRVFALDDGPLAHEIENLVISMLKDKVLIEAHDSMLPNRQVWTFTVPADFPVERWSSGEQAIWNFLESMAGTGAVSLRALAEAVGGQYVITVRLVQCFSLLMNAPDAA
jgi:hypothetical protein